VIYNRHLQVIKGNKSSRMSCTQHENEMGDHVARMAGNNHAKKLREKLGVCGRKTLNTAPEKSGLRTETGLDQFMIGYNSGYI
jgi:hypothetical protein